MLFVTTPLFAKEWTAAQKDVLKSFDKYIAAARQGDIKEMMDFWHPQYVGWDYAQKLPMNYDAFLKGEEDFYKNYKFVILEYKPLEIQVDGNMAIIHLGYDDIFSDFAGKQESASGHWTAMQ